MREPYFMQQLHKQRTRASDLLETEFKGDWDKFYKWRWERTKKNLLKSGFVYQANSKTGIGYIREKQAKYQNSR